MKFISDYQGSQKQSVDAIDLCSKDSCDNKARVLAALARCHQDLVKLFFTSLPSLPPIPLPTFFLFSIELEPMDLCHCPCENYNGTNLHSVQPIPRHWWQKKPEPRRMMLEFSFFCCAKTLGLKAASRVLGFFHFTPPGHSPSSRKIKSGTQPRTLKWEITEEWLLALPQAYV